MSKVSGMWKLNIQDFGRGAVTALFAALLIAAAGLVSQPNFDLFTADWASIARAAVNAGFAAFVGYLVKNLTTDAQGRVFGRF